uniref:Putative LAGLIDADG endonuclease n=1 Tax=Colletotrichum lindemuthianum TaxID=290576 RepID=E9L091_COLLN|nr:putative LAGLIDADG endonuclease [Colletotrichum lindemuthianum]
MSNYTLSRFLYFFFTFIAQTNYYKLIVGVVRTIGLLKSNYSTGIDHFNFSNFYDKFSRYLRPVSPSGGLGNETTIPSTRFLSWFIGFTEGEGSFIVNNRGDLCFVITQSNTDIKILHFIKETLGFGKVIPQSANVSRFVTQNKREIEIIVHLFNGNIILPSRKTIFDHFVQGFNTWVSKGRIKLNTVEVKHRDLLPSLKDNWLAGFTDAEGCFTCSIGRDSAKGFSFNFNISQKWGASRPVSPSGGLGNEIYILEHLCVLFKQVLYLTYCRYCNEYGEYKIVKIYPLLGIIIHYTQKNWFSYKLWKEIHKELLKKNHLDPIKRVEMIEKSRLINKF